MALTLFASPWAPVPSSQAAEIAMDVECTSSVKSSFPPNTERQTLVDAYAPCTSTDSTLKSGTRHVSSPLDVCNIALGDSSGTDEIVWNNGTVSTWEYTREVSLTHGSVTIHQTGTITAGAFVGDSATEYLGIVIPGFFLSAGTGGAGGPNGCETAEGETHTFATGKLQITRS